MKTKRSSALLWMAAVPVLLLTALNSRAQTQVLINAFDNADEVNVNNGNPWANWFGTAFNNVLWDPSDASNNPASGSMQIQAFYPDSGIGGCCGPQFVAYDQNSGINPPLIGNGGPPSAAVATNISFDVRFDPTSQFETNNGTWPTIEVGTRGNDPAFGQHDFGTFSIPNTQTNWVHESIAIAPNASWTNIPNVYFKYFSTTLNGFVKLYVDNIVFTTASVPIVPPVMSIQKPIQALRVFAGSTGNTFDREHLTSIDTNQSWVGGTFPVSYSFKLLSFPTVPTNQTAVFRYHIFLVPLAFDGGNAISNNEFLEFQANNNFWLNISGMNTLTPGSVQAQVAWKTNLPNSNPTNIALQFTNSTAVGTWTLTFTDATDGTVTAPGGTPQAFSIPSDAAAQFANPVIAQFGVQPDSGWGEGQWVDVAQIQTSGVASPGVAINDNFLTDSAINTNVWDVSNSAPPSSHVPLGSSAAWWVFWTYPDYGSILGTKADLASAVPWETPQFYTGFASNAVFQAKMGNNVWALVPTNGLPTVDGSSNGVPAHSAYFKISNPGPIQ